MTARSAYGFLNRASDIMRERGAQRDQGQERSMGRAVAAFNAVTGRDFKRQLSVEDGWLLLQLVKLVRQQTGPYHEDDYLDDIGYAALKAEAASAESPPKEER